MDKVAVIDNGVYKELTDKIDIKNACHGKNKVKFTQTNNALAMMRSLIEDLGFLGNNNTAKRILEGTY